MKKLLSTTIAVGIFASLSIAPVFADVPANALPNLVEGGAVNANIDTVGNDMNIQITGGQGSVGTLTWQDYNVGSDASVNYEFTAHNQTALNRVVGNNMSQIYGRITTSGCSGCGYDASGKVILINPNGVLFGDGANVNLNSFTVSTMDGTYDAATRQLKLDTAGTGNIYVMDGAVIHAKKGVTMASNKEITQYAGSKITTNVGYNDIDSEGNPAAYGKVKLVTSDGVNFTYYENGAVQNISDVQGSANNMRISLNGEITSGNIDVRNASTHTDAEINLNGAKLKATKIVNGNDGNIWLTSANKIVSENSEYTTVSAVGSEGRTGGNVKFDAAKKISIGSDKIAASGNVIATGYDVNIDNTGINALKDLNVTADNHASIQLGSNVKADNVQVVAGNRAQIHTSVVTANKIDLTGKDVYFENASLYGDVVAKANNDMYGDVNFNSNKAKLEAGHDMNLRLYEVGNRDKGLVAKAGNNMKLTTNGALSVSSLISGNDMTITANNVISGYDKTTNHLRTPGDSADRAYIEVGGTFTSNPGYEVTDSADLTADGLYNQRHHIQYGDGSEKILLVNKRPAAAPSERLTVDGDQAQMLNKLPRQPEVYNNAVAINDGRTTFVDVFAAASQIEIVDDEEEE